MRQYSGSHRSGKVGHWNNPAHISCVRLFCLFFLAFSGEVFMAASGLPVVCDDHATLCAYLALDMLLSSYEFWVELEENDEEVKKIRQQQLSIEEETDHTSGDTPENGDETTPKAAPSSLPTSSPTSDPSLSPSPSPVAPNSLGSGYQIIGNSVQKRVIIRVGLHSGDVVAGVVGFKLPQFRMFGRNVNIASRMESTCPPNRIQLSEVTHDLLDAKLFECEDRGDIPVKGIGPMHTYFLQSSARLRQASILSDAAIDPNVAAQISSSASTSSTAAARRLENLTNLLGIGVPTSASASVSAGQSANVTRRNTAIGNGMNGANGEHATSDINPAHSFNDKSSLLLPTSFSPSDLGVSRPSTMSPGDSNHFLARSATFSLGQGENGSATGSTQFLSIPNATSLASIAVGTGGSLKIVGGRALRRQDGLSASTNNIAGATPAANAATATSDGRKRSKTENITPFQQSHHSHQRQSFHSPPLDLAAHGSNDDAALESCHVALTPFVPPSTFSLSESSLFQHADGQPLSSSSQRVTSKYLLPLSSSQRPRTTTHHDPLLNVHEPPLDRLLRSASFTSYAPNANPTVLQMTIRTSVTHRHDDTHADLDTDDWTRHNERVLQQIATRRRNTAAASMNGNTNANANANVNGTISDRASSAVPSGSNHREHRLKSSPRDTDAPMVAEVVPTMARSRLSSTHGGDDDRDNMDSNRARLRSKSAQNAVQSSTSSSSSSSSSSSHFPARFLRPRLSLFQRARDAILQPMDSHPSSHPLPPLPPHQSHHPSSSSAGLHRRRRLSSQDGRDPSTSEAVQLQVVISDESKNKKSTHK